MTTTPIPVVLPRRIDRSARLESSLSWATASIAAVLLVLAALFLGHGGRWFVVETPSMGEAAPVGTLVLDLPVDAASVHVGQIVTFRSPVEQGVTFTHRVVRIDADGGIHTRGDVNGATDPWTLRQADLVGSPVLLVPHIGWLFRAAGILLLGGVVVGALTSPVRDRVTRTVLRISGAALVVSAAAFVLRPFVGVETIETSAVKGGVEATVVSTGMFPVKVHVLGGGATRLVDGEVGHIVVRHLSSNGHYLLASSIDLSPAGWVLLGMVCVVPLVACLRVGRIRTAVLA